jgi:hypothetical protein
MTVADAAASAGLTEFSHDCHLLISEACILGCEGFGTGDYCTCPGFGSDCCCLLVLNHGSGGEKTDDCEVGELHFICM